MISSDIRLLLRVSRRAIEIALNDQFSYKVQIEHVNKSFNNIFTSPIQIYLKNFNFK